MKLGVLKLKKILRESGQPSGLIRDVIELGDLDYFEMRVIELHKEAARTRKGDVGHADLLVKQAITLAAAIRGCYEELPRSEAQGHA